MAANSRCRGLFLAFFISVVFFFSLVIMSGEMLVMNREKPNINSKALGDSKVIIEEQDEKNTQMHENLEQPVIPRFTEAIGSRSLNQSPDNIFSLPNQQFQFTPSSVSKDNIDTKNKQVKKEKKVIPTWSWSTNEPKGTSEKKSNDNGLRENHQNEAKESKDSHNSKPLKQDTKTDMFDRFQNKEFPVPNLEHEVNLSEEINISEDWNIDIMDLLTKIMDTGDKEGAVSVDSHIFDTEEPIIAALQESLFSTDDSKDTTILVHSGNTGHAISMAISLANILSNATIIALESASEDNLEAELDYYSALSISNVYLCSTFGGYESIEQYIVEASSPENPNLIGVQFISSIESLVTEDMLPFELEDLIRRMISQSTVSFLPVDLPNTKFFSFWNGMEHLIEAATKSLNIHTSITPVMDPNTSWNQKKLLLRVDLMISRKKSAKTETSLLHERETANNAGGGLSSLFRRKLLNTEDQDPIIADIIKRYGISSTRNRESENSKDDSFNRVSDTELASNPSYESIEISEDITEDNDITDKDTTTISQKAFYPSNGIPLKSLISMGLVACDKKRLFYESLQFAYSDNSDATLWVRGSSIYAIYKQNVEYLEEEDEDMDVDVDDLSEDKSDYSNMFDRYSRIDEREKNERKTSDNLFVQESDDRQFRQDNRETDSFDKMDFLKQNHIYKISKDEQMGRFDEHEPIPVKDDTTNGHENSVKSSEKSNPDSLNLFHSSPPIYHRDTESRAHEPARPKTKTQSKNGGTFGLWNELQDTVPVETRQKSNSFNLRYSRRLLNTAPNQGTSVLRSKAKKEIQRDSSWSHSHTPVQDALFAREEQLFRIIWPSIKKFMSANNAGREKSRSFSMLLYGRRMSLLSTKLAKSYTRSSFVTLHKPDSIRSFLGVDNKFGFPRQSHTPSHFAHFDLLELLQVKNNVLVNGELSISALKDMHKALSYHDSKQENPQNTHVFDYAIIGSDFLEILLDSDVVSFEGLLSGLFQIVAECFFVFPSNEKAFATSLSHFLHQDSKNLRYIQSLRADQSIFEDILVSSARRLSASTSNKKEKKHGFQHAIEDITHNQTGKFSVIHFRNLVSDTQIEQAVSTNDISLFTLLRLGLHPLHKRYLFEKYLKLPFHTVDTASPWNIYFRNGELVLKNDQKQNSMGDLDIFATILPEIGAESSNSVVSALIEQLGKNMDSKNPKFSILDAELPRQKGVFSFLELNSGSGITSMLISSAFSDSSVISLENSEDLVESHEREILDRRIENNIVCKLNVDELFFRNLYESPEFLRFQLYRLDILSYIKERSTSKLGGMLGKLFATGMTTFVEIPSSTAISLSMTTFFDVQVEDLLSTSFDVTNHPNPQYANSEARILFRLTQLSDKHRISVRQLPSTLVDIDGSFTSSHTPTVIARVDTIELVRHVSHHFDYRRDGHSRKYTLNVNTNDTIHFQVLDNMQSLFRDESPSPPYSPSTTSKYQNLLPEGFHWNDQSVTSVILTRETDSFQIPYIEIKSMTLIAILRMGLTEQLREKMYHQFLTLPLYEDMAPWNIVYQGKNGLNYIDYDTRDKTFDDVVPLAYQILAVLMNYKRTVEDFKKCDGKAQTVYGLPYISDCVRSRASDSDIVCKDLSRPVPCPDKTCQSDYISCLRAIVNLETVVHGESGMNIWGEWKKDNSQNLPKLNANEPGKSENPVRRSDGSIVWRSGSLEGI